MTVYNDIEHEVCETCGCIVGHGCQDSAPCWCEDDCEKCDGVGYHTVYFINSTGHEVKCEKCDGMGRMEAQPSFVKE